MSATEVAHFPTATLEARLDEIRRAPSVEGRVELIVRRPEEDAREVLTEGRIEETEGLVGDNWSLDTDDDGSPELRAQITIMNARSAAAVAGERERWALAGDQLFVDFDLSEANLPPGTRIEVGEAVLEVTVLAHRGCGKFSKRFGVDALKFVNSATGRELNLRGINTRVVRGGLVRTGDAVRKLTAPVT